MKKKFGVLLSGCGFYDGAEIQETVLTLLALERAGVEAVCFAPDKDQFNVVNHLTGKESGERRNVLVESARLTRGNIEALAGVSANDFDALILPGGFGAAKNLCTFATEGASGSVDRDVRRLIRDFFAARKPMGFLCISPAIAALVMGETGVELTIGNDSETAKAIEACGAKHVECTVTEVHCDPQRKIISTPAYMLGQNIAEVSEGIEKLVQTLVEWVA